MRVDRHEVLRYLRMGRATPDAALETRLTAVEKSVLDVCRPASYWRLEPVTLSDAAVYTVGGLSLSSDALRRTLTGCRHAFLFCATLGAGVDALLRRYAAQSGADVLMAQAVATALIEQYCDECEVMMLAEPAVRGERLRMRFAPGYGDLPLETQTSLLTLLDAQRRAGITLTETMLMIPSKSVSAIIGVAPEGGDQLMPRCAGCEKTDCDFKVIE